MLSSMADPDKKTPPEAEIASALAELNHRAILGQEVLVDLAADAIGVYLTEYCIEMEMRVHGIDFKALLEDRAGRPKQGVMADAVLQAIGDSTIRWLRNVGLVSPKDASEMRFTSDNALGKSLQAMVNACASGDEKAARKAIQSFVHSLYHDPNQSISMVSQNIEPGKVKNYREYVDNYVTELTKHEKALDELELSGKLTSPKEYSNLRTYRRQFGLFREGLSRFPRVPDTLVKLIPPFGEAESLPRNPVCAYQLAEINALIIQRKTNICREQERSSPAPQELKGTFFDSSLLPRRQDPVIATLYETGKKSPRRVEEKVRTELGGRWDEVKDAARCKIVVDDIDGMMRVSEILSDLSKERGFTEDIRPIRMNSRGAWDAKRNVELKFQDGEPPVEKTVWSEVQIIDRQMQDLDVFSHQIYELMRNYPLDDMLARDAKPAQQPHDAIEFSRDHQLRVESFRDFVREYNTIAERLNSNTSRGVIGAIREQDPDLFALLRKRVQSISDSQMKTFITARPTAGNVSPGLQPSNAYLQAEALGHLTEMLKNLQFLHQGITSFSSLSRINSENRGAAHPTMSAAYYLLAFDTNKRQTMDVLKIPDVFLPNDGKPFSRASQYKEFSEADLTHVREAIETFNAAVSKSKAAAVTR